jgi:voltage-gated potassium channel
MTTFHKKPETLLQKFNRLNFVAKIEIEIFVIVFLVIIWTLIFHKLEGWRYLDSLYFIVTTLGAVGYGDFYPKTDLGKIIAMCYIIIGMPLFIYTAALVIEWKVKSGKK